jgi:hypothetical protein
MNGTNSEVGEHRNNQDNDGYSCLSPPSRAGGVEHGGEHSVGGHGAQFRFYLPGHCGDLTFPQVVFMGIAPK